ncbi:hypothetical protein INT43_001020 [Umbelopsis isabellina]|uniref:MFS general substrate transporter n=1 Tax=Mortierella isabellina TaxID=91625 RepID=A0A8H7UCZ5_MORIS|nr:hypothetical protein INT43_001020 [Umbelopsis isabellina]
MTQVVIVGFVAFCLPGLYNTITGMGAAGMVDPSVAANANVALYCCGIVSALFIAPLTFKYMGNYSMFVGGFAYVLYMGSLWAYGHIASRVFCILAGALLGIGAQMFWIAQGSIMTSYPVESEKGRAIAIFWVIFNLGGFLGSLISFAINFDSTAGKVSDSTYIAFTVLMIIGACLTLLLLPRSKIVRKDGSKVDVAHPLQKSTVKSVLTSAFAIFRSGFVNPKLLALVPLFFSSNFVYSYQFDKASAFWIGLLVNGALFNVRTRGLNGALYWGSQMLGSVLFSLLLDHKAWTRRKRAITAVGILFVFFNAVWIGGLFSQLQYGVYSAGLPANERLDLTSGPHYGGELVLYICFGLADSMWQTFIYWIIGTLSNEPAVLGLYTGFFKAWQNAGAAAGWKIDASGVNFLHFLIACWVLVLIAFPGAFWVAFTTSETTGYSEEIEKDQQERLEREKLGDDTGLEETKEAAQNDHTATTTDASDTV